MIGYADKCFTFVPFLFTYSRHCGFRSNKEDLHFDFFVYLSAESCNLLLFASMKLVGHDCAACAPLGNATALLFHSVDGLLFTTYLCGY